MSVEFYAEIAAITHKKAAKKGEPDKIEIKVLTNDLGLQAGHSSISSLHLLLSEWLHFKVGFAMACKDKDQGEMFDDKDQAGPATDGGDLKSTIAAGLGTQFDVIDEENSTIIVAKERLMAKGDILSSLDNARTIGEQKVRKPFEIGGRFFVCVDVDKDFKASVAMELTSLEDPTESDFEGQHELIDKYAGDPDQYAPRGLFVGYARKQYETGEVYGLVGVDRQKSQVAAPGVSASVTV